MQLALQRRVAHGPLGPRPGRGGLGRQAGSLQQVGVRRVQRSVPGQRADLLERAGRAAEASAAWARAERAMGNAALQRELHRRRDAAAGSELAGPAGKRAADHVSFGAADPVSSDADSALVFWFPAITPGSRGDFA